MEKTPGKIIADISLEVIVVALMFVASVFVFAYIAHEVVSHQEAVFDEKAFRFFSSYTTDEMLAVMRFLSFFGKAEFLIPVYILMVWWFFYKKQKHYAISVLIIGLTSIGLVFGFKEIFERERPPCS